MVYTARDALEKTLESVASQDYSNKESIIIDGGSKDGTLQVISKFQNIVAYWVSEPDEGIYDAMNKGISMATGDYITFLNAGDEYCNSSVLNNLFQNYNGHDVIYGDIFVIGDNIKPRYQRAKSFTLEDLLKWNTGVVCHQAFFVKRNIIPFYNTSYKYKAELNWYFDIVESNHKINYLHIDMAVVNYSLGGLGYTNIHKNIYELCKLIILRYGLRTFFKYNYPRVVLKKLKYRYPNLNKYI